MTMGFYSQERSNHNAPVAIDQLRAQAMTSLASARGKLTPAFKQAANDTGDDMMAGALLSYFIFGFLFSGLESMMGMEQGAIHGDFLTATVEAGIALHDDEANGRRARKLDAYPEGRRQYQINEIDRPLSKKFNMVSVNDNGSYGFSFDAEAEVTCLIELLDNLEKLEKNGITAIAMDEKKSAYNVVKGAAASIGKDPIMSLFSVPVRKRA